MAASPAAATSGSAKAEPASRAARTGSALAEYQLKTTEPRPEATSALALISRIVQTVPYAQQPRATPRD